MPQARASIGSLPDSFSRSASGNLQQRQTAWIATSDSPRAVTGSISLALVLSRKISKRLLCFAHLLGGELSRFNQVRHDGQGFTAEQCHQFVDHPVLRRTPGDHSLENMSVADLLGAAYRL